jgi:glucose-1-phosphate thymidylyltransferase
MNPKAVILAGGEQQDGYRSRTSMWARELVPIANKPLVSYALDTLRRADIADVAIVVDSATSRPVREAVGDGGAWSLKVSYLEQGDAGLAAALRLAEPFLGGAPFVLHLGDSLSTQGIRPYVHALEGQLDALLLLQDIPEPARQAVVELTEGRLLKLIKRPPRPVASLAPAGVYLFGPKILEAVRDVDSSARGELGLADALERLIELGGRVETRCVNGWWRYEARPEALLEANRLMLEGLAPDFAAAQLLNTRIQGAVAIDPSARLDSTTVRGPAIIGPGTRITDAYIGPYTAIGGDVTVEGAEIEHSIILPGAIIKHVGGRIETSVIGTRAKVFRDFRLPRAMRLCVGDGAEVSLA